MKKTLILGTNSNIGNKEIIDASRSMGVSTVMTDYYSSEDNPLKLYADEHWDISTANVDALEERCRVEGITGVYGGTDYAQDVALELAERLGLPSYCDKAAWHFSRDKAAFKAMCRKYGVPVAEDAVIGAGDVTASSPIGYPVVVKPTDRSGNVGVSYCFSDADYAPAVEEALARSENGKAIVERMLTGREYHSLYILRNGETRLLCLASMLAQPGTPNSYSAITSTVVEPSILKRFLEEDSPRIEEMLKGMGCRDGIVWLEIISDNQGALFPIEMGHRLSAEMLWMPLKKITGFDTAKWMAHYAAYGNNDDLLMPEAQNKPFKACACAYDLRINGLGVVAEVRGLNRIREELQATTHVAVRKGNHVNSGEKGVVVSFSAMNCEEMCRKIRVVNETITMVDESGKDLMIRFDDFETLHAMHSN